GVAELAQTAAQIVEYVQRDLTSPEGGFYCAEDADSEGQEGRFYVWTVQELEQVLGPKDAAFVSSLMGATVEGNYQEEAGGHATGANILHRRADWEAWAKGSNTPVESLLARWESARVRLLAARSKRVRPLRDDKVLADWNGLMIAALARAGGALEEPAWLAMAERAAAFVWKHMRNPQGRLLHRYRQGEAAVPALLDDHAFLAWAFLELYE